MKIVLFLILNLFAYTTYSQTTCFGTDQVPMLDVIELQEKGNTTPLHKLHHKLSPNPQTVVKSVTLEKFSMNQGAPENVQANYFKNSANEDVSRFQYANKTFYRVRNSQNGCTATYELNSNRQELYLLASMPSSSSDGFFIGGSEVKDYQDPNLAGASSTNNNLCKPVQDGIKIFSVVTKTCGRIKFCEIESICKDALKTEKYFCKSVDDNCPDLEACKKDQSFSEIYKDFEEGTFRRENLPKASPQ
jgi:hypothetical protein